MNNSQKLHDDPRLVLIHPPAVSKRYLKTKFMPYGMAVLYSFLAEHDVPVVQFDFLMDYLFGKTGVIDYFDPRNAFTEQDFFCALRGGFSHAGIRDFVDTYSNRLIQDAGMYAFSIVSYQQFWASLLIADRIRRMNERAVIVFGGPFITIKPPESFVPFGIADYWVKGSGEEPLLLLYRLSRGDSDIDRATIPGLVFYDSERLICNPQSHLPAEEERPPDFSGLPLESYRYDHPLTGKETFFLPYRIAKGCPSRCSFCTGRLVDRYDCKSVDKIVSELKSLAGRYETNMVQFADASINGHPVLLAKLCDRLVRDFPDIRWYSYAKIDAFDASLLRKVKAAGCFSLFWGAESAHQPTIRLLGKHFRVADMFRLLDEAVDLGIKNYLHLMYNVPHESDADVEKIIGLVERYRNCDLVSFLPQRFLLEPQTAMFEHPQKYGLTNVRRVGKTVFDREQYIYDEISGPDHIRVELRDELHREALAETLEWIRYRNLVNSEKGLSRFLLSLPFHLRKFSAGSPFLRKIHQTVTNWIESRNDGIQEQL
ncbi:MAG TPA: radical SAM protein [Desulfomonilaceae bacterium]|nr:radical SAM protein [Desulfomonilaceae bacterium]